jgi:excisionase family DNA binding protein
MNPSDMLNDHHVVRPNSPSGETKAPIPFELITAVQLAELLSISERTLYRLKSTGQLPKPISLGGSVRWRITEVRSWIAQGCPKPT